MGGPFARRWSAGDDGTRGAAGGAGALADLEPGGPVGGEAEEVAGAGEADLTVRVRQREAIAPVVAAAAEGLEVDRRLGDAGDGGHGLGPHALEALVAAVGEAGRVHLRLHE